MGVAAVAAVSGGVHASSSHTRGSSNGHSSGYVKELKKRRREEEKVRWQMYLEQMKRNNSVKSTKVNIHSDFTEKFVWNREDFSEIVAYDGYAHHLADGSYVLKSADKQHYTHYLPNGTTRVYKTEGEYSGKGMPDNMQYVLECEKLPDGRFRAYEDIRKYSGEALKIVMTYERDADGNYKRYKYNADSSREYKQELVEEGKIGEISYIYDAGVVTIKEPNGNFVKKDSEGHKIMEGTENTYKIYYPNNNLKEEKKKDGTIYEWHLNNCMKAERFPNGMLTEWDENKRKIHVVIEDQSEWGINSMGEFFEKDSLHRVIKQGKKDNYTEYSYYGNSSIKTCTETQYVDGKVSSFKHFDEKGQEDTLNYIALRRVAQKRIEEESKLTAENQDGGRVILPKMNDISKKIAYWKAKREIKNGK